jgi:hypothetical protein
MLPHSSFKVIGYTGVIAFIAAFQDVNIIMMAVFNFDEDVLFFVILSLSNCDKKSGSFY